MSLKWIIDDEGECWSQGDAALARHLGTSRSGQELVDYTIRNLGFIGIEQRPRNTALTFDRSAVAPEAIVGVLYWFEEHPFRPTEVRNPEDATTVPLLMKPNDVVAYLGDCMERGEPGSTFSRRKVDVDKSVFSTRWEAARAICTTLSDATLSMMLLDQLFQGHYAISTFDPTINDYRVEAMGSAYRSYDKDFVDKSVGRTFRDTFDRRYGNWIADCFREYHGRDHGVFAEACRATISWPDDLPRRFNFERLILPIGTTGERLLTASFVH